eukprot:2261004-Pleurochrysis_carterae.AAC.1
MPRLCRATRCPPLLLPLRLGPSATRAAVATRSLHVPCTEIWRNGRALLDASADRQKDPSGWSRTAVCCCLKAVAQQHLALRVLVGSQALSRGMGGVTFVDFSPKCTSTIKENCERLGFEG